MEMHLIVMHFDRPVMRLTEDRNCNAPVDLLNTLVRLRSMKTLLIFLMMGSASVSHAMTNGRFLGQQFMINIAAQNPDGGSDDFPRALFDVMNVPIQDSMLGPGKVLKTPDKTLNFISDISYKRTSTSSCLTHVCIQMAPNHSQ